MKIVTSIPSKLIGGAASPPKPCPNASSLRNGKVTQTDAMNNKLL